MAERFTKFILKLGEDPALLAKVKRNPHGTMKKAGLTAAERVLALSRNSRLIRAAIMVDVGGKPGWTASPLIHITCPPLSAAVKRRAGK